MDVDLIIQYGSVILGLGCLGWFVFQSIQLLLPDQELLAAQQRLGVESASREYKHWSLKLLSPFYRAMTPRIQQIKMPLYRQKKRRSFVAAGLDDQFDPDEFVGLKLISSVLTLFFVWMLFSQFGGSIDLLTAVLIMVIGFFLPDFVIWETRKKREKAILKELPTVMDLLTLSVEAGMDFMAAISRVIEFAKPGPLKEELSQVLKEIQLGTNRSDALRNMAERTQIKELSSFSAILIQADQMGSSIGPVLRAQSDLLRLQRFNKAEREGAKATQKMLLPMIVFIFPGVFIVILGPVIIDTIQNSSMFQGLF